MRTLNWAVLLYLLAAVASVAIPLGLVFSTQTAPSYFPQPNHQDLLRAAQAILPEPAIIH